MIEVTPCGLVTSYLLIFSSRQRLRSQTAWTFNNIAPRNSNVALNIPVL